MPKKKTTLAFLNTYRFAPADKDPVIDRLHTMIEDEGLTLTEVKNRAGISRTTLTNWFDGPTRRPQFATVAAVAGALGYRFALTAMSVAEQKSVEKYKYIPAEAPSIIFRGTSPAVKPTHTLKPAKAKALHV